MNTIRQHTQQVELQKLDVEGHIRTHGKQNLEKMSFFGIQEDNKILMEPYETSFIEKFKTALNKYAK